MSITLIFAVVSNMVFEFIKWNSIGTVLLAVLLFQLLFYSVRQIVLRLKDR